MGADLITPWAPIALPAGVAAGFGAEAVFNWTRTRTWEGTNMSASVTVPAGQPSREDARRAPRKGRPFYFLVAVLVLVNAGGTWGQAGWFHAHVTPGTWPALARLVLSLVLALAVELTGVYLSMEADDARRADQPSLALQLGAYGVGALAGWLNWQHFHAAGTETAAVFAGLSVASPILWAIWSKARNRLRLVELGQAGKRGLKLSGARKVWHPLDSIRVMSWASWQGVTDEDTAVRGWTFDQMTKRGEGDDPAPVSGAGDRPSKAERWTEALAVMAEAQPVRLTLDEVGARMLPPCSGRWLRECRRAVEEGAKA